MLYFIVINMKRNLVEPAQVYRAGSTVIPFEEASTSFNEQFLRGCC